MPCDRGRVTAVRPLLKHGTSVHGTSVMVAAVGSGSALPQWKS